MFRLYDGKLNNGEQAKIFMRRRFARLYPLHLFMLLIFVGFAVLRLVAHKVGIASHEVGEILPFTSGAQDGWGSLLSHLTLTHAMGVNDSLTFNPPSWTISAEFFTYFVFVAMMLWIRPKKALHFMVLGVIVIVIYTVLSQLKPNMDITYDYAFLRCVAGFFTGVIAAKLYSVLKPKGEMLKHNGSALSFTILEAIILLGSTLFVIYCGGKAQFFVAPILLAFMIIFAFDGGLSIFGKKVLAAIIPNWDNSLWAGDVLLLIYLCAVIAISHLTYHYIEVPGGRFIRNFKRHKSKSPEKPVIETA